jgi:hypothetical protein
MSKKFYYYDVVLENEISPAKVETVKHYLEVCEPYFPGGILPDFELKWIRLANEARYKNSEELCQKIIEGLRRLLPEAGLKPLEEKIMKDEGSEFVGYFRTRRGEEGKIRMTIFLREDKSVRLIAEVALNDMYYLFEYVRKARGPCALDLWGTTQDQKPISLEKTFII